MSSKGGFIVKALEVVADEDEGCPVVGMGEGVVGELAFDVETNAARIEIFKTVGGAIALEEGKLGLVESFGFGDFSGGELGVEVAHEEGGGGVVDEPEGGHDGFCAAAEEEMPESGDFHAFCGHAAFSGFAGAEDDEVSACEVFHAFDRGNGQFFAVSEEEEGVVGVFGEGAVGGDVEDAVVGDVFAEGGFGEVLVEALHAGEDFVDAVEFALDGGEGTEASDRLGDAKSEDGVFGERGGEFVGGVGLGGEDG